jgi:TPR repeat protein
MTPPLAITVICCGVLLALAGCKPKVAPPGEPGAAAEIAPDGAALSAAPSSTLRQTATPEVFLDSPGGLAFAHGAYDVAYRALSDEAPTEPRAAYLLGHLFQHGLGITRNPQRAIRWYLRAAEADLPEAHFALGMMAAYGRDLPGNYNEGFRWFKQAAELGHAEASLHVGLMYANGQGIARDPQLGLDWVDVAVAKEVPGSIEARAAVLKKLGSVNGASASEARQ